MSFNETQSTLNVIWVANLILLCTLKHKISYKFCWARMWLLSWRKRDKKQIHVLLWQIFGKYFLKVACNCLWFVLVQIYNGQEAWMLNGTTNIGTIFKASILCCMNYLYAKFAWAFPHKATYDFPFASVYETDTFHQLQLRGMFGIINPFLSW